jgi:NAD(P)H-dependent FMN reductase
MTIGIIIGSHRAESESTKIGKYLENLLKQNHSDVDTAVVDLRLNPLPLWSEDMWSGENNDTKDIWAKVSGPLIGCDAFIVISPEWGGMASSGLKNFFLYAGGSDLLAFKPGYLVTVSSGRGGAYPVAELRMSSYKNTFINYLPEHLIIRDCENVFNKPLDNEYLHKRAEYGLNLLVDFADAFKQVRNSGTIDLKNYPYGM